MKKDTTTRLYEKDIDVLAVNGVCVDWLLKMPKLPSYDEKLTAEYLGRFAGGPVGNFACMASSFGMKVSAACTLGKDESGDIIRNDFIKYGVDTTYIVVDDSTITLFVIVIVDPKGEKAVIIPRLEESRVAKVSEDALARSKYAYLLAADYENTFEVMKQARSFQTKFVLDIEPSEILTRDRLREMLPFCDIASFNQEGFTSRFGQPFDVRRAQDLLALGPSLIVVTRGKSGSLAVSDHGVIEVPGYPVEAKDTTGAGDTFNAAFMSRYAAGDPLEDCLRFGNAAAALLIQTIGTRTHIPTIAEIRQFIKNHNTN